MTNTKKTSETALGHADDMDDKSLKDFFNMVLDLARKTGMQTCLLMIVDKDGGTSHGGYGHLWHELALLTNCLNSFLQDARIQNEDAAEILRSLVPPVNEAKAVLGVRGNE